MSRILILFFLVAMQMWGEPAYAFGEIWAYVFKGEEKWLKGSESITDIAYFGASVNEIGMLGSVPQLDAIPVQLRMQRKVHLVVAAPGNKSLMYWILVKDKEAKNALIDQIIAASEPFDGVQIDFESIRPEDRQAFWQFLREVKERLPKTKVFSIAVLPRMKLTDDCFHYQELEKIADRVVVMAYDEHWRSGTPGAIASLGWCQKITHFAKTHISPEKLIMGIPLYGRVWQKQEVARSLKYYQMLDLWKKHPGLLERDSDDTAHFEYREIVDAVVYFEDVKSLSKKLEFYEETTVDKIAFWRITQEPAALWQRLSLKEDPKNEKVLDLPAKSQ